MTVALALLAFLDQYDRLAEKVRLPDETAVRWWSDKSDAHRKIIEMIADRRNWARAFESIDQKLGIAPGEPDVAVSIEDSDDRRPACSAGRKGRGTIRFNMRHLADYQRRLDEVERQKKAGKDIHWVVPPMKLDAVIPHELTHVVCGGHEDLWVAEGLASYVAADDVVFYLFNYRKARVDSLSRLVPEDDAYARGMSFLLWLEKERGLTGVHAFTRKVCLQETAPSRAAADALGEEWDALVVRERLWSADHLAKFKPAP